MAALNGSHGCVTRVTVPLKPVSTRIERTLERDLEVFISVWSIFDFDVHYSVTSLGLLVADPFREAFLALAGEAASSGSGGPLSAATASVEPVVGCSATAALGGTAPCVASAALAACVLARGVGLTGPGDGFGDTAAEELAAAGPAE